MKVLLLGSGGREHALAWKIAQSEKVEKLFIAPGNAGTAACGENVAIKADDFEALKQFTVEKGIDMVGKETAYNVPAGVPVPTAALKKVIKAEDIIPYLDHKPQQLF